MAGNPGPFTLSGTCTYVVGRRNVAVVDPGPDLEEHVAAVAASLANTRRVSILLTHGHQDHAGAVDALAAALAGGPPVEVAGAGHPAARPLEDGATVPTDAGSLVALHAPGHTPDHLVFLWPDRAALFSGDLILGRGDTTWVADYPGCVADYLHSLERLRGLALSVIYPGHGPPVDDPGNTLDRYERHRRQRIAEVREASRERPGAKAEELLRPVYGDTVPPGLERAALASLRAVLEYLEDHPEDGPEDGPRR